MMHRPILAGAVLMTISAGISRAQSISGEVTVTPFETRCGPAASWSAQTNDIGIRLTGDAAIALLNALKERVPVDKEMQGLGLSLYKTKDGHLECDESEDFEPLCRLSLDLSTAGLEPIPVCE